MNHHEQPYLSWIICASVAAVIVFLFRRWRGSSRSMSTWLATMSFGGVIALGIFLVEINRPQRGMGLEPLVLPPIALFVSALAGGILAMLVYIIENRKPVSSSTLSPEARKILRQAEERKGPTIRHGSDWRSFARSISR